MDNIFHRENIAYPIMLETVERVLPHSVNSAFIMNTSTSNVDDGTKLMVIRLKM